MPGYKALPEQFSGAAAEQVRVAEVLLRSGDAGEAVRILEQTLQRCAEQSPELPGWLCGRLAALYRTVERYDDEVLLLERYRDSQTGEEARTRFDARLSKARAVAERKRPHETHALASVRGVMRRSEAANNRTVYSPMTSSVHGYRVQGDDEPTERTAAHLRDGFQRAVHDPHRTILHTGLRALCDEAFEQHHTPERVVTALKRVWRGAERPDDSGLAEWDALYRYALTTALEIYFEERAG